jgi:two-component system chemotaxis sensor kinase CheA
VMPPGDDALRARLRALFLDELDELVGRIGSGLDHLAAVLPGSSADTVDELFRSAHSLKGAAQAVGATQISSLCHELEDSLAMVRDGSLQVDAELLGRLGRTADAVAELGETLRREQAPPAVDGSAAHQSVTQPRPKAPSGLGQPDTVRVGRAKWETLLELADDVITTSHGYESFVRDLAEARARFSGVADRWRQERAWLMQGSVAAEDKRLHALVDWIDARARETSLELDHLALAAANHQRGLRSLTAGFADAARAARTVPFTEATAGLARMVRDLSFERDRRVRLLVEAAEVEIDRELVVTVREALGHLIRNAVDHGIEPPEERVRAGKPETGTVTVTATLQANAIEVTVVDDGRGVDESKVRKAVTARQSHGVEGEINVAEALFEPGLSTAAEVTAMSGRGVGLDAVRTSVEAVGGTVTLHSEPGAGTGVRLLVPLRLSMLRAVLVRVAGESAALPVAPVRTLSRVPSQRRSMGGRVVVELDGEAVPLVQLARVLGWSETPAPEGGGMAVVIDGTDGPVMLVVEDVLGEREIVLRSVPDRLADMPLLLGTTQLEDGALTLVLNPAACVRDADRTSAVRDQSSQPKVVRSPRILLVEDTLTTRELERSVLEAADYTVTAVTDGRQAWDLLQQEEFDIVVSDVNMPHMDGIALCQAVRASPRLASLPVVLLTSLHSTSDRLRGMEAGADAYLVKSGFDRQELLDAMARLL